MGVNGCQSQLRAVDQPNSHFSANQELIQLVQNASKYPNFKLTKIGIVTDSPFDIIVVNNEPFQIGFTYQLQLDNVDITSMYFANDTSSQVIIDYVIQNRDG